MALTQAARSSGRGTRPPPSTPIAQLGAVLFVTGFCALGLQVSWQRVLALHAGVDMGAATVVVAAFLAGLGGGNLLGGRVADRVGRRSCVGILALAEAGLALMAAVSVPLLRRLAELTAVPGDTAGALVAFGLVLLGPTVLMGMTIPLAGRAVSRLHEEAGPGVSRLYGMNAVGAAAGALVTGWVLIGELGIELTVRVIAAAELAAAAAFGVIWWRTRWRDDPRAGTAARAAAGTGHRHAGWWIGLYGLTGAVALGLQQVFLRLVDTALRSNAYSFSLVIGLYLACFGIGSLVGGRLLRRVSRLDRAFLMSQAAVGVLAAAPMIVLARVLPVAPFDGGLSEWFSGAGFRSGFAGLDSAAGAWTFIRFGVLLPLAVLGPAVVAAGVSFAFVEQLVTDDDDQIGRRTGTLIAVNLVGNVGGALLTTFVLLELLGTASTLRLLAGGLLAATTVLLLLAGDRSWRTATAGALTVAVVALLPGQGRLWGTLHGTDPSQLAVVEDRTCVASFEVHDEGTITLVLNGAPQNSHPFDDFHVLLGLLPVLEHPNPQRALAVGLGIGSTSYALLRSDSIARVTTAELCGGNLELIRDHADGRVEFQQLIEDERHHHVVADGRAVLRGSADRLDVVAVDTLLPESASSGTAYSIEFYRLVAQRISEDGLFVQWVPTDRVLATAAQVFEHVSTVYVPSYHSTFMVASRSPLRLDAAQLSERFEEVADDFSAEQADRLREFFITLDPTCIRAGQVAPPVDARGLNTDLHPRDEFFLNNPRGGADVTATIPRC